MALGRLQGEVNSSLKSKLPKPYLARLSFGVGVIGLIIGSVMACDCWGWFICAGAFFVYPFLHGTRPLAIAAALLGILSLTVAIAQFRSEVRIKEAKLAASGQHKHGDKISGLTNIPDNSKVVLNLYLQDIDIELPEQLRKQFIAMLHEDAIYIDFSRTTAAPVGKFLVAGKVFDWHGNAIVEGERRQGRVWTSPMMQALINRYPDPTKDPELWKQHLRELDSDTNILSTPLEPLTSYPDR